jgi:DNA polymerase (family 10)
VKNKEIAAAFNEIADILEIQGKNRFRINAYRRGAQSIENLSKDIAAVAAEGTLGDIPGIGKDLRGMIEEYLETGRITLLDGLRDETPRVLLDMLRISGVGPKTAVILYEGLEIESLDDLKKAAQEHRIQGLPKIKAKTEENILKGIEFLERSRGRTPIGDAYPLAREIIAALGEIKGVKKISIAGSLRRWRETVGDIDILVTATKPESVIDRFTHLEIVERVLAEGKTKGSIVAHGDIQVDLRAVEAGSYGAALNYFTGAKEHNIRLREIAIQKNMKLNEYGVFKKSKGAAEKRVAGSTERSVYRALGLPFIPPEIREDAGEIEAARRDALPDLITREQIRGDLHFHSDYSDGTASLEEVARAGKAFGYTYIAITDHSQSLRIAHGLSPTRLRKQFDEIDRVNERIRGFRLLKGSEVDILPDGALDMDEKLLARLDVVIVAIHSKFKMKRDEMTRRVITAFEHPRSHIFAHPTGRLIGTRDAYAIDMEAVIEAAARTSTAIEINAHPLRLDLDSATARAAAEAGVMIAIGTDTHTPGVEMENIIYGVGTARRGWLEPKQILNTRTPSKLISLLHGKAKKI